MIITLLALLLVVSTESSTVYVVKSGVNKGKICDTCPPGTYKKRDCDRSLPTVCEPCGDGEYTSMNNSLPECLSCNHCYDPTEIEITPCNATTNTVCSCKEGYTFDSSIQGCI
ncbi:TNFR-like protein [Turkeypox virus]|uniref:TNFR-like protein n=1 Tax=Turkeypox virus TaxID=336486 RepID=A0A0M3ZHS8_9POXV|nr:TNFR-like protein [Turkeypox virus]ALA62412.1 TNFR-like protein [Turkeypox virus]